MSDRTLSFSGRDVCGQAFATKGNLKGHQLLTHSNVLQCKLCDNMFRRENDLKTLQLIHDGVKFFKCDICNKYFTTQNTVKRHN